MDRERTEVHRHPLYYAVRNHVVDFLVSRSKTFASEVTDHDTRNVPVVRPGVIESSGHAAQAGSSPRKAAG